MPKVGSASTKLANAVGKLRHDMLQYCCTDCDRQDSVAGMLQVPHHAEHRLPGGKFETERHFMNICQPRFSSPAQLKGQDVERRAVSSALDA